jgi:hypothetical protein
MGKQDEKNEQTPHKIIKETRMAVRYDGRKKTHKRCGE